MDKKLVLKKEIHIQAPVHEVWRAITDPAIIKKMFFGSDVESDWKEGGPLVFSGEWEGKKYEDKGVILKMVPGKLFKYNYWSNLSGTDDIPENYADITYQLEEDGQHTRFLLTQEGFKDKDALEHSRESWDYVLDVMKQELEKQK